MYYSESTSIKWKWERGIYTDVPWSCRWWYILQNADYKDSGMYIYLYKIDVVGNEREKGKKKQCKQNQWFAKLKL